MSMDLEKLTPRQIVAELDKYIIGQHKAKKAVSIALRNRIRRSHLASEIRDEVAPKNIIMVGPTGVGKTEIARRLSRLSGAPFIKVEATKFTEVGYIGRDVESMIRDLMAAAVSMLKKERRKAVMEEAVKAAEEAILDILLPRSERIRRPLSPASTEKALSLGEPEESESDHPTRELLRKQLREGLLDERKVVINIKKVQNPTVEIFTGSGMEEMDFNLGAITNMFGGGRDKKREVSIKQAQGILLNEQIDRLIDEDETIHVAKERVQNMGIIFIDEIDKIANREGQQRGQDVSREGVQRDILPIVEGSSVNTKYGPINTSHILFIAAGAFNLSKPSDLIPELQGRFPIRVELDVLDAGAFERILTQPRNALTKQYKALLETEGVTLEYTPEAIIRIAKIAEEVNGATENIGARRLYTVMEKLLEDLSFEAESHRGEVVTITEKEVNECLVDLVKDQDLSRYIL